MDNLNVSVWGLLWTFALMKPTMDEINFLELTKDIRPLLVMFYSKTNCKHFQFDGEHIELKEHHLSIQSCNLEVLM